MNTIPESHRELLSVWCMVEEDMVLVGTTASRRKSKNIRQNPRVAICVLDPEDAYHWIDVRGVVEEMVPDSNFEVINQLAKIYTGADSFYGAVQPAEMEGKEDRVVIRIKPDRVVTSP
jgi:PPOX class probable F420-dependent enzyme